MELVPQRLELSTSVMSTAGYYKRGCVRTEKKPQISPLRYPGFPVEFGGVGDLHAAFLNESRTRGHVQRRAAGNPGALRSR